jgi:hypothetical protein
MQDWWSKLRNTAPRKLATFPSTAGRNTFPVGGCWDATLLVKSHTPIRRCFKRTGLQYIGCIAFANLRVMKYDAYDGTSNPSAGEEQQDPWTELREAADWLNSAFPA